MKYYKSKRNMGRMVVVPSGPSATPFRDHEGGCPINQPPKSKILNASSVAPSGPKIARLSEKNVKYIEDLKKILGIVKQ